MEYILVWLIFSLASSSKFGVYDIILHGLVMFYLVFSEIDSGVCTPITSQVYLVTLTTIY